MTSNVEIVASNDSAAILRISGKDECTQETEYLHLTGKLDCVQDLTDDDRCIIVNANIHSFKWSHVSMDVAVKCLCADGTVRHNVHGSLGTTIHCQGAPTSFSWTQRLEIAIEYAETLDKGDLKAVLIWIEAPNSLEWDSATAFALSLRDRIITLRESNCYISIQRDDLPRFVGVHTTVSSGFGACMLSDRGQFDLGDVRNDGLGTLWVVSPLMDSTKQLKMVDEWLQWLLGTAQRTTPSSVFVDVDLPPGFSHCPRFKTLVGINKGDSIDFTISQSTRTLRITLPSGSEYDVLVTLKKDAEVTCIPKAVSCNFDQQVGLAIMDCASADPKKAGAAVFFLNSVNTTDMDVGCVTLLRSATALAHARFPSHPPLYTSLSHIKAPHVVRRASGV
tara:strand:- start:13123 stop:14298 length:1176 start_codon:yes stop_codon:yes gene_type:complete